MNEFHIEQFPKNKDIDKEKLNEFQIFIRSKKKSYIYGETKTCNNCFKEQPIDEFYVKNKETGRRNGCCRDCQMKKAGVIEIGKIRFAEKIENKGFRRCSICKEIKPLHSFSKNKSQKNNISNNCYDCSYKLHYDFQKRQKEEIGDFYVREYCKRKYGIIPKNTEDIEKYRDEIRLSRKPKYFLDNKSFKTCSDLARYVELKYNIPITTTEKRINEGVKENECKIPEKEYRSLKSGTNKGKIKVTDTVTGNEYLFFNTCDKELRKMIGAEAIKKGIETGMPVGGYRNSLWKNPLIIKRINK